MACGPQGPRRPNPSNESVPWQSRLAIWWTHGRNLEWRDQTEEIEGLALQLRFDRTSESMGDHDSGGHGCLEHRLKRRLSCGRRRCEMSKRGWVFCLARNAWRLLRVYFWTACSVTSGARPDGCAPRRLAIPARGASRLFWAGAAGMRMRCVTSRAITRCKPLPTRMRFSL